MPYPRPESRAYWAAFKKEHDRKLAEWRKQRAQQFLQDAGSPSAARKLLAEAIKADEEHKKRPRGRQYTSDLDVYALAYAIQQQEGYKRRRALLAAMRIKGIPADELRRLEDRIRGMTLAQIASRIPIAISGRVPVS